MKITKDRDLCIYSTISNESGSVELTAGFDVKDGEYFMSSMSFKDNHPLGPDWYDADTYIFNTFYNLLCRYRDRMLTEEDKKEFSKVVALQEEDVIELIDIIEQAIDFGWDKLKL